MGTVTGPSAADLRRYYAEAACADQPTILFDATHPMDALAVAALAYCAACPVVDLCNAVLQPRHNWFDGVAAGRVWWNGVERVPGDRRGKRPPTERPRCGTEYGYEVHRQNSEWACQDCRDAKSAARRDRRTKATVTVTVTMIIQQKEAPEAS